MSEEVVRAISRDRQAFTDMNTEKLSHTVSLSIHLPDQSPLQSDAQFLVHDFQPSLLPEEPEPTQCDHCDEFAVQELWQEVREFCDCVKIETEMAPQSVSSSMPPPMPPHMPLYMLPPLPPSLLSEYLENNNITVRECKSTTPDKHFGKVGTRPNPSGPTLSIDANAIQEELIELQQIQMNNSNPSQMIEDVFFPRRRLRDPYFKIKDATLSTGEISLERILIQPVQQRKPPRAAGLSRSTSLAPSKSTSRVSKRSAPSVSSFPSSSQSYPIQVTEQPKTFLNKLFPHTTFWLTRPNSVAIRKITAGVFEPGLMCPYLTIVQRLNDEPPEVSIRAALIATCILSSQVKALKSTGRSDQHLRDLRHYVIIVGNLGFNVFETAPVTDGGSGYVMSTLDSGPLPLDCGRFGLWVDKIHEWAVKVWKPIIMAAFSPKYLDYDSSEVNGDPEREARDVADEWQEVLSTKQFER